MKELHRYWFTTQNGLPIGIIKCQDETTKEIKYCIGFGDGFDEDVDAIQIMKYGDKFYINWL